MPSCPPASRWRCLSASSCQSATVSWFSISLMPIGRPVACHILSLSPLQACDQGLFPDLRQLLFGAQEAPVRGRSRRSTWVAAVIHNEGAAILCERLSNKIADRFRDCPSSLHAGLCSCLEGLRFLHLAVNKAHLNRVLSAAASGCRLRNCMAKEEIIEFPGVVTELLPNATFPRQARE